MRPLSMSGHFLLSPIPESSSDYLLPKDIKLAVLGAGRVGKSAMIVRFLTKRFIGDYEPNTGKLYSRLVYVEGDQLSLQIQDTPGGVQHLCKEVSKMHGLSGERRRASIIPRPRSPNMQDLKRRFKQALSPKVKAPTALG
ncbi:ras-like protein family member 11A isoform X2 [Macaca fascicularis]|uniref:ras-like protein family member 11A isoform X2 n=1 Tax=Macaca fascicularis TaxID=9541 RepID=UPI003D1542A3